MKNDFCVEEMMETQFPHLNPFIREDYPLTTEAIEEWLKRCMADFPNLAVAEFHLWFYKWFSQFKEEGEE